MDDIYCEGLLHIRSLQDDHYIFNEKKLILTGKKTKNIYSLGMRINVRIVKINIAKRQIDLDLAENFIPM
jgi:ribonuclease R